MNTPQPIVLSNIKNMQQLLTAKAQVKQQCTDYETELKSQLKELPANTLKAAAFSAVQGIIGGGKEEPIPSSAHVIKEVLLTSGMELLKVLLRKKSFKWMAGLFK
jgi:hypothetical protein